MIRFFTSQTQVIGQQGENVAVAYLKKEGYSILGRNINNKYGEIDIFAKKKGIHYFFEVKTGKSNGWLNPAENLTKEKLRKFLISIEHYCLLHDIKEYRVQGIIVYIDQGVAQKIELLDIS